MRQSGKGTTLVWASETQEEGWKRKSANIANSSIAFSLELFYDKMRTVLKCLCQGVLFLYMKAAWRESSLASQGLSPKCPCPSAHGRSESLLRRQWRW